MRSETGSLSVVLIGIPLDHSRREVSSSDPSLEQDVEFVIAPPFEVGQTGISVRNNQSPNDPGRKRRECSRPDDHGESDWRRKERRVGPKEFSEGPN